MTWRKREIMEMAREAGLFTHKEVQLEIEAFAELVRENERNRTWTQEHWTEYERSIATAEREACEIAIEELLPDADRSDCVAAIRARGQS